MKTLVKRALVSGAKEVGRYIPTWQARQWFCNHVVPYLLDPAILPSALVERPTKRFGIRVLCDPYVYVHRNGYWCGVFFEEDVENYLLREIRAGDTVLDVGMNVGHVALPAAALVGAKGQVLAFEPNTELVSQVRAVARAQRLDQLEILPYGLGDVEGEFELHMDPAHLGGASFRDGSVDCGSHTRSIRCQVKVGDEVLSSRPLANRVFLKVDVEGFEIQALEGLARTLGRVDHAIVEISPEWLGPRGVKKLFGMMEDSGLHPHLLNVDGTVGQSVLPETVVSQTNVVFRRPLPS